MIHFQSHNIQVIALDLEGTLIQDCLDPKPRPGLFEFLSLCESSFERVVIMTTVREKIFREIAFLIVKQGYAPKWFSKVDYIVWEKPYKDLCTIGKSNPEQILIVDDYEGYIHPNQKKQWIQIETFFERENDVELYRIVDLLKEFES